MTDFEQYRAYQCGLCGDNCINHREAPETAASLCISCYTLTPEERAERARSRQFSNWFNRVRSD